MYPSNFEEIPARPFARYVRQYARWGQVARSLPSTVDLDAMEHAARDEAKRRRASESACERGGLNDE